MSTSPKLNEFATSSPPTAAHDTNPDLNITPNSDAGIETPRNDSSTTILDTIRTWWTTYRSWREDVRDDQISCTCPISGPCRCEAGQVTVAGPS